MGLRGAISVESISSTFRITALLSAKKAKGHRVARPFQVYFFVHLPQVKCNAVSAFKCTGF